MPIYEYICQTCGYEFERILLGHEQEVCCPECESKAVKKSMSLFTCSTVQLNKRLRMDSEGQMKKGAESMGEKEMRKSRIKIL